MKATFQIPDELYREVTTPLSVDWRNFKAPLAHLIPENGIDHSMEAMRDNIVKNCNEPS